MNFPVFVVLEEVEELKTLSIPNDREERNIMAFFKDLAGAKDNLKAVDILRDRSNANLTDQSKDELDEEDCIFRQFMSSGCSSWCV